MRSVKILVGCVAAMLMLASASLATPSYFTKETISHDVTWTDGHKYTYASCIDLFQQSNTGNTVGAWAGCSPSLPDKLSWCHTLPDDLSVPPDIINRAKLWIDGYAIDTEGNRIRINGTWGWDNLNNDWLDNSSYSLTNVKTPGFWNNGKLCVDVYAREWSIRIDKSLLLIDYTNVDGSPTGGTNGGGAVPEPATLLLVGFGLAGAAVIRRKK